MRNWLFIGLGSLFFSFYGTTSSHAATEADKALVLKCTSNELRATLLRPHFQNEQPRAELPENHWKDVAEATLCIAKESPYSERKDNQLLLNLYSRREKAGAVALFSGATVGPNWIRVHTETNSFDIVGMVYIGGGIRANCTWSYTNITSTFANVKGDLSCRSVDTGEVPKLTDVDEWLESSFGHDLDSILRKAMYIHTGEYWP